MENLGRDKSRLIKVVFVLVVIVCVYFATKIVTEVKSYSFIGGGAPASNVISFAGSGEVYAKPDLATISFTIRETQKEVKTAQDKASAKETAVLAFLEGAGIAKKDIKTESYGFYPKYDYETPCYYGTINGIPCRQGEPTLIGYEVSEYITVKVRDLAKVGDVVKGVGALSIAEMSGPNFSVENENQLKEKARKMAIDEAKAKAEGLSRDLGVRLVRIVNFSEDGSYPMMYAEKAMDMMGSARASVASPTPEIPTGENKIMSNVSVTYEIR